MTRWNAFVQSVLIVVHARNSLLNVNNTFKIEMRSYFLIADSFIFFNFYYYFFHLFLLVGG